jgi:hypothetical protein
LDVAPSLSALLGIPVPRQATGVFIDEFMLLTNKSNLATHYEDLYHQKQTLLLGYLGTMGRSIPPVVFNAETKFGNGQFMELHTNGIQTMLEVYEEERSQLQARELIRNLAITIPVMVTLCFIYLALLQCFTVCKPLLLLPRFRSWKAADPTQVPIIRKAFVLSFGKVASHHLLSISFCLLTARFWYRGYSDWEWTPSLINTVVDFVVYIVTSALLGIGTTVFVHQVFFIETILYRPKWLTSWKSRAQHYFLFKYLWTPVHLNYQLLDAMSYFDMMWSIVSAGVLVVLMSSHYVIMPSWLPTYVFTPVMWNMKFRVATVGFLFGPYVVYSVYNLSPIATVGCCRKCRQHDVEFQRDSASEIPSLEGSESFEL